MKIQPFAVTAKSFSLYEAFKKEAESLGWVYDSSNAPFKPYLMTSCNCLYFYGGYAETEGIPSFYFHYYTEYTYIQLETNWDEAIEKLKLTINVPVRDYTYVTLRDIAKWKGCTVAELSILY